MSRKKAMKISGWIILVMTVLSVLLPLFISGCVMTSPFLSARDNRGTIIIEKPPVRLIYSGEYPKKIDVNGTLKLMKELDKMEYKDHDFEDKIEIDSVHQGITSERYESTHTHKH